MFRQFFESLSSVGLMSLPVIAMGIFLAMFVVVLVRACQKARAPEYDRMASLPLDHDSQPE